MSEAVDIEINSTDIFESRNYDITSITAPLSPDSTEDLSLTTLNLNNRGYEENRESNFNKVKHKLFRNTFDGIKERACNIKTREKLEAMIKVRSLIVLFVIICSVILLFQIPIILYYTDPPTVELFAIPDLDAKSCSVRFLSIMICIHYYNGFMSLYV